MKLNEILQLLDEDVWEYEIIICRHYVPKGPGYIGRTFDSKGISIDHDIKKLYISVE